MDNELFIDSLLSLDRGANCVEFNIGFLHLAVFAGAEEKPFYKLSVVASLLLSEDEEEEPFEKEVWSHYFKLSDEEFAAAIDSSSEDFMFVDNVDSLVSQRVTKGIMGYVVRCLGKENWYGHPLFSIGDKIISRWEAYTKELIGKRMRGELISNYIPGYEPKDL